VTHETLIIPGDVAKAIRQRREDAPTNMKADVGKVDMAALPLDALAIVARVFEHGNRKYGLDNWLSQDVATLRRYAAAALRHLMARQRGEILDESGLPHLAHAVASLLIALHHETQPRQEGLWR
jgi:hypothetical protein